MRSGTEIVWILDGVAPERIPMARLAEYLRELAALFGEADSVHFDRVEKGSTRVIATLSNGVGRHRVQSRVYQVRDGRAPADAQRAYDRINEMVCADKTRARIMFGSGTVLRFSGASAILDRPVTVINTATVTGRLYALLEDNHGRVNGRIRSKIGNKYITCIAEGQIAKKLANCFQEVVRLNGRGAWSRDTSGVWTCEYINVHDVFPVNDVPLRDAINALRAIEADWPDDPLGHWADMDEQDGAA